MNHQTVVIAAGNNPYGTAVELWNGTNWSIIASLSLGRQYNILSGTTNDAITYGGRNPSTNTSTVTENYNGTSWSTDSNMISSRQDELELELVVMWVQVEVEHMTFGGFLLIQQQNFTMEISHLLHFIMYQ